MKCQQLDITHPRATNLSTTSKACFIFRASSCDCFLHKRWRRCGTRGVAGDERGPSVPELVNWSRQATRCVEGAILCGVCSIHLHKGTDVINPPSHKATSSSVTGLTFRTLRDLLFRFLLHVNFFFAPMPSVPSVRVIVRCTCASVSTFLNRCDMMEKCAHTTGAPHVSSFIFLWCFLNIPVWRAEQQQCEVRPPVALLDLPKSD